MDRATPELIAPTFELPHGVLEMVLANLKRRHLLSIISFVCKRWRRAALASVRKLTIRRHVPSVQSVLSQMKGLTCVCIGPDCYGATSPLHLPSSVTDIVCKKLWASPDLFTFPPLRRIELQRGTAEQFTALLAHSHASLATLVIDSSAYGMAETVARALAHRSLPSLTDLTVAGAWHADDLPPFLARHASQLVSLSLFDAFDDDAAVSAVTALPFPLLLSLSLRQRDPLARNSLLSAAHLARLLNGAPHLTALTANQVKQVLRVPASQLTCLVDLSLACSVHMLSPSATTTLFSLPHLHTFHADESNLCHLLQYPDALLKAQKKLLILADYEDTQDVHCILTKAPNIESLHIGGDARLQLSALPDGLTLGHLRYVRLTRVACDAYMLATLHCLLSIAPHIKRLTMRFDTGSRLGGNASSFGDVLHGLLQRGCKVCIEELFEAELLRAQCDNPWNKLVVTIDGDE